MHKSASLTAQRYALDKQTDMSSDLELFEDNTHVFMVKVWLEERENDGGSARWRGHITHVPSGERSYIQTISGIIRFLIPYFQSIGVRLSLFWRLVAISGRAWSKPAPDVGTENQSET